VVMKEFKQVIKEMKIKLLTKIILCFGITTLSSCVSKNTLNNKNYTFDNEDCLRLFNSVFSKIQFGDSIFYQFDNLLEIKPNFVDDLYSTDELSQFIFFELRIHGDFIRIAILQNENKHFHQMYFVEPIGDNEFIDETESIIADLSFLNDYGYKMTEVSIKPENFGWLSNEFDEKYIGEFVFNDFRNCECSSTKLNTLEITNNNVIVNNIDTLSYSKQNQYLINKVDSTTIFTLLAYTNQKILIKYDDCTLLFSRKNE
jgi:hypothetical protein